MSYIHEALKKAQKERDTHRGEYDGVLSTGRKRPRTLTGKVIRVVFLSVIILFLAFGAYSWLNSKAPETIKAIDRKEKRPEPPPRREPVIDPKEIYDRAKALHVRGSLTDARRLYLETLKADPGYVDAMNNLGVIYIHDKDYPAARSVLEKATRLRPGFVDPYYNLACVSAIRGEPVESLGYLRKAISLHGPVRDWAKKDADLKNLWGLPEFQKIIQ